VSGTPAQADGPRGPLVAFGGLLRRGVTSIADALIYAGGILRLYLAVLLRMALAFRSPRERIRRAALVQQAIRFGVQSIPIIVIVQVFVGIILVLAMARPLDEFGQLERVATVVALAMFREMGALFSAVILSGFAGASIAAEIGAMVEGEEIKALKAHALDPIRFLVVPRILATTVMMIGLTTLGQRRRCRRRVLHQHARARRESADLHRADPRRPDAHRLLHRPAQGRRLRRHDRRPRLLRRVEREGRRGGRRGRDDHYRREEHRLPHRRRLPLCRRVLQHRLVVTHPQESERRKPMPLVVGIDEAGYGPLLGPLIVGATTWHAPADNAHGDWWATLDTCVCKSPQRGETRIPVGDSKKLFDRKKGLSTLERSVLAFSHVAGLPCTTLDALLRGVGYTGAPQFPWYRGTALDLPRDPARSAYAGAAQLVARTLAAAGLKLQALNAEVILEDDYNARLARTHNKATIVVEAVLRLVHQATRHAGDQDVHVFVDRLGGRANYRTLLMTAFPDRHLHELEQDAACSRYRLAGPRSDWYIAFKVGGDATCLPIALASMLAKYLRELLMEQFNAFWCERAPALQPTAGYYQDAQRFLAEIEPLLQQAGFDGQPFVRAR
jgi:ribonuclease HII